VRWEGRVRGRGVGLGAFKMSEWVGREVGSGGDGRRGIGREGKRGCEKGGWGGEGGGMVNI